MLDQYHREIEYLRLSLTPRCNLSCFYCRPGACPESPERTATELLTPAECERIVRAGASLGLCRVRLTGGEPLLRTDLEEIVSRVHAVLGITDLSLTTNGQGLAVRAAALKAAGLDRVNISLDSLKADRFRRITGGGALAEVLAAIDACLAVGLTPIKLNTVLVRGVNDDETGDLIALTRERPLAVRFIELMPMNDVGRNDSRVVSGAEVLAAFPALEREPLTEPSGPAEVYRIPGHAGTVGLIRPISHRFCSTCNRIRITADGMLKPCLGDLGEISLRAALAEPGDEALLACMQDAIYSKPEGHTFGDCFKPTRGMDRTGG